MWQLQWALSLIPDSILIWLFYLLFFSGVAMIVASWLVKWIPMISAYKFPVELVGILLYGAGAFFLGGHSVEMSWRDKIKELQAKIAQAEVQSKEVNIVIQTKIVERVKVVEKQVEVVRTQIERDKEIINAECKVPDIAIKDYNDAVADPLEEKK
jgi:hypothetical protein